MDSRSHFPAIVTFYRTHRRMPTYREIMRLAGFRSTNAAAKPYRTIRPKGPLDQPEDIDGAALETLVFQELQAHNTLLNLGYTLYYWRTSNNIEVDFVLYGPKGLHAFEIKRTGKVNNPNQNPDLTPTP